MLGEHVATSRPGTDSCEGKTETRSSKNGLGSIEGVLTKRLTARDFVHTMATYSHPFSRSVLRSKYGKHTSKKDEGKKKRVCEFHSLVSPATLS